MTRKALQAATPGTILLSLLVFLLSLVYGNGLAAQTPYGDYTLYSQQNSNKAYLLDMSGNVHHSWTFPTNQKTSYSCYLEPGGTLVRNIVGSTGVFSGPTAVAVQKADWNGNVTWTYNHSSSTYCLHHDICPMPNGNVLLIAYELKTAAQATQAGSSVSITIWSEKIIEVQPTGASTGNIVWEWHLWDHLCQNVNTAKDNYVSSIVNNPQLININFNTQKDWMHMNGIDYNPVLDQITFSSHNLNEIYVIDHSTTTAQAAGHSGGNSGKGGDILYRWGNPAAYGALGTKIFSVVHDAHWIPYGSPKGGYLAAFNNKGGTNNKSCVDLIDPPYNGYTYSHNVGTAYSPSTYNWRHTYSGSATSNMGSSEQLPNGNTLICIALSGYIYEIDSNQTVVWSKSIGGSVPQAHRYTAAWVAGGVASATATPATICLGDSTQLFASLGSTGTITYSWTSTPAGFTSSSQNPIVSPSITTLYTVIASNGTITDTAFVTVTVNPALSVPLISQNGNILNSSAGSMYQWYLNGVAITGATNQSYTATQSGNYQVKVTNATNCSAMSAELSVTVVGISEPDSKVDTWRIYPNPAQEMLFVEGLSDGSVLIVGDIQGRSVLRSVHSGSISLDGLAAGMYFVRCANDSTGIILKLIIQ
jgi:hypothetical protein